MPYETKNMIIENPRNIRDDNAFQKVNKYFSLLFCTEKKKMGGGFQNYNILTTESIATAATTIKMITNNV